MAKYKSVLYDDINKAIDLKRALERSYPSQQFFVDFDRTKQQFERNYWIKTHRINKTLNQELQAFETGFYFGQEFTKLN